MADLYAGSMVGVFGLPRYGKTTLVQTADAENYFPRRTVFSPRERQDRDRAMRGEPVSPWNGTLVSTRQLLARPSLLDRDDASIVVQPDAHPSNAHGLARECEALLKLLEETEGVDALMDEVALYSREAWQSIRAFASGAGHFNAKAVWMSQQPSLLTTYVRKQLSLVVCFGQTDEDDLKALRGKCGKEFAEAVRVLPKGSAPLCYVQGRGRV